MKKTVLFAAAIFAVTAASAQTGEITSNRGENWLSQDGDWGLTFEATPLLNYAGNLFNGNTNNNGVALNNLFSTSGLLGSNPAGIMNGSNVVIGGKKLIDANTAYRGKLRIGFGSQKSTELVEDLSATQPAAPAAELTVENVTKANYMAINLGFGLEKRVGSTRVVGIYGAELNVGFGSSKRSFEYGNAQSSTNPGDQVTEEKNGSVFGVGLNAFAGIEWFCAPKISLSGEYTWGLMMRSQGLGSTSTDHWVPTSATAGSTTSVSVDGTPDDGQADKTSSFSLDTGISGASIGVNFYFQ